jgi:hypothetical protein
MQAVDSAGHPPAAAVVQAGYPVVCSYYAPLPNPKVLTKPLVEIYARAGLALVTVWEGIGTGAAGGQSEGVSDAQQAVQQAQEVGQPKGTSIFGAVDFEPTGAQLPIIVAYFQGFVGVLRANGYKGGPYGADFVCDAVAQAGFADHCWQTVAWSGGRISPKANMLQLAEQVDLGGVTCDLNNVITPNDFGAWTLDGVWPPQPKPQPKGNDVLIVSTPTGDGYHTITPGGKVEAFGDAAPIQNNNQIPITAPDVVTGATMCPLGGFWVVTEGGAVFSFGKAEYHGGPNDSPKSEI